MPSHLSSLALIVCSFSLMPACGGGGAVVEEAPSRVVLYRNGVGYFERDAEVHDGRLDLAVRNHELDDVLSTLAVVGRGEGAEVVPVAALPAPAEEDEAPDWVHHLRFAVGQGARRVRVAWATQTPAWRVSYRLVLGDATGAPGHLSGWAVVDNTTAEDWRGIQLTLATAEPSSFAVDLRTPRYVARPDVTGYIAPRIAAGPVFAERVARDDNVDRDGDGILDVDDVCPDDAEQYNGMQDEDGCPDRGAVMIESAALQILEAVYFDDGSTEVGSASRAILEAVAATLQGNPEIHAEIHGHADARETEGYRLAAERAGAVRQALAEMGVDPTRLTVRSFGATQPLDPRNTREAHAHNRRVTFSVERPAERTPAGTGIDAAAMARAVRGQSVARTGIGGTRYTIQRPIDVPAGRSVLALAVSLEVPAEELYLFRPTGEVEGSDVHPFRAAQVQNDADVDLVPGPVALYGHGRLLGQGMIGGLRGGEDVVIPWALDDATEITRTTSDTATPQAILSVSAARAVLRSQVERRVVYRVRVGRHAPRRMLIRHALHAGAELYDPPPGTESGAGDVSMVPLPIASGETSTLTLVERWHVDRTIDLRTDIDADLEPFLAGTSMTAAERARFEEIRADRTALRRSAAQSRALRRRLDEHGIRTAELRAALDALPEGAAVAAVRRRLAAHLLSAVNDGEAISAELASIRAAEVEARGRLRAANAAFVWPAPVSGPVAAHGPQAE